MNNNFRRFLKRFHPEGIPAPVSNLYNLLTKTDIFQKHYDLVAQEVKNYCKKGKPTSPAPFVAWN